MLRRQTAITSKNLSRIASSAATTTSLRTFSSNSLNQPAGVTGDDLISNIKSSHQATAGLRFAETQRRQEEKIMQEHHQKYRDGLLNPDPRETVPQGVTPIDFVQKQQQSSNNSNTNNANGSSSSLLHYQVPSNPLTIGRDQLVVSLWQSILSGRRALFLTGPDGIGSSTVASQFAEHARRSGRFSCIHWFDCARTTSNVSSTSVGTSVREPALDQLKKFVKDMRNRNEDEVLLIFDHPENPTEILEALHATFVAMKSQDGNGSQEEKRSSSSSTTEQNPASPAKYLFSGPPKLSENDLRAHYSRLHLLFVTPQRLSTDKQSIVNPIDDLLQVQVSVSHRSGDEISTCALTLASEFCPAVFNVDPVDEVPAMLLTERLIQNHISEYYQNQVNIESNFEEKKENNKNEDFPPAPPAISDPPLLAITDHVARVPLLLVLASQYVAAELLTSPQMAETTKSGEVLVSEEHPNLFNEIIDGKLIQKVLAPAMKNKTEENPEGTLSISAAAGEICVNTIRTVLSKNTNKSIVCAELVEKVLFALVGLNISDLSHSLVEALVVEFAKEVTSNEVTASYVAASSINRERVVNEVELLLRRAGFLSDSLVLMGGGEEFSSSAAKKKMIANFSSDQPPSFEGDEVYNCHVALADGLLNIKMNSKQLHVGSNDQAIVFKVLRNLFIKASARKDYFGQLRVARHLQAMTNLSSSTSASSSSSSSVQSDLYDRVASFLSSSSMSATKNESDIKFIRKLWFSAFNEFSSSTSNNSTTENKETAARIGLDLGRLLLAQNNERLKQIQQRMMTNSSSNKKRTDNHHDQLLESLKEEESREYDFIANLLARASQLSLDANNSNSSPFSAEQVIASKNLIWAEITSLRARMMDPEQVETLQMFSAAAQIIEHQIEHSSSSSSSTTSLSEKQENALREEYFVLLVAWAKTAECLGKEIPEQHWNKMKKLSSQLKQQQGRVQAEGKAGKKKK